jgi:hypothetical protein
VIREVLPAVQSVWRAFLLGAGHAIGVVVGLLVLGAWLWGAL